MWILALRNLTRQKLRSAITLGAIVTGVLGLILSGGFVNDILFQLGEFFIKTQSGHIQIAKQGFFTEGSRKPENYLIAQPETLAAQVRTLPGVRQVITRLHFSALLSNGRAEMPVEGEGIGPEKGIAQGMEQTLVAGRPLKAEEPGGILLGETLAKALNVQPGDNVTLLLSTLAGATNTQDFVVQGIFRSFSKDYDARAVRLHLSDAQALWDSPGANTLMLFLTDTALTERVMRSLQPQLASAGLEARSWHILNDFYGKTVELYDQQFGVLRFIIFLMVLLGVANSINMTAFERFGEFGTIRALGYRSGYVFRLFLSEQIIMAIIASTLGVILGIGLAWLISYIGIPMPAAPGSDLPYVAHIRLNVITVAGAWGVGVVATLLAGLWPAYRLAREPLVDALRHNV